MVLLCNLHHGALLQPFFLSSLESRITCLAQVVWVMMGIQYWEKIYTRKTIMYRKQEGTSCGEWVGTSKVSVTLLKKNQWSNGVRRRSRSFRLEGLGIAIVTLYISLSKPIGQFINIWSAKSGASFILRLITATWTICQYLNHLSSSSILQAGVSEAKVSLFTSSCKVKLRMWA